MDGDAVIYRTEKNNARGNQALYGFDIFGKSTFLVIHNYDKDWTNMLTEIDPIIGLQMIVNKNCSDYFWEIECFIIYNN